MALEGQAAGSFGVRMVDVQAQLGQQARKAPQGYLPKVRYWNVGTLWLPFVWLGYVPDQLGTPAPRRYVLTPRCSLHCT